MTVPAAALPGRNSRQAPTTYHDAPADAEPLGCPMCGSAEHLVLLSTTVVELEISAYRVGVTRPEYDTDAVHVPEPDPQPKTPTGIRCEHCHWGYSGVDPLARLGAAR